MRILWIINQGIGNVVQSIPAYLNIVNKFGKESIDVRYMEVYETDSISNMSFYPANVKLITMDVVSYYIAQANKNKKYYDYVVKVPFVMNGKSEYEKYFIDNMREGDSEVRRNLRIAEFFGADIKMLKKISFNVDVKDKKSKKIVVHNGGLNIGQWRKKKYPYFDKLINMIYEKYNDIEIVCIGSKEEYIQGCVNKTGISINETISEIASADLYIGTDTGTYHLAALLNVQGIVLFTFTDENKNYDKIFHKTIVPLHSNIDCRPCQRGYNWIYTRKCEDEIVDCQKIDLFSILKEVDNVF